MSIPVLYHLDDLFSFLISYLTVNSRSAGVERCPLVYQLLCRELQM